MSLTLQTVARLHGIADVRPETEHSSETRPR